MAVDIIARALASKANSQDLVVNSLTLSNGVTVNSFLNSFTSDVADNVVPTAKGVVNYVSSAISAAITEALTKEY